MQVIAISGHAQNGKDTVANLLSSKLNDLGYQVLITHYADLLKYICKTFFGWDGNKDEDGRRLLQYVGTDIIKNRFPNFWVDFIAFILKNFSDNWDWVLIPDTRFPNEIHRLREEGFDVIHLRVVRGNFKSPLTPEQQQHPSETALYSELPDYFIHNNGTLEDLDVVVSELLNKEILTWTTKPMDITI